MTDLSMSARHSQRGVAIPAYYEFADELPVKDAPSLGACWPKHEHQLLLTAACASEERARSAWQTWSALPNSDDLDRIDTASARLFPQVASRLWRLGCKDSVIEAGLSIYRHTWYANQLRVRAALDAIDALRSAGVTSLALKGLALLAGYYPDLGSRPMLDLDLLVPPAQLGRALLALTAAGWQSVRGPIPPHVVAGGVPVGYSWQLRRGLVEIDLHWHALNQDASRTLDDALWESAVRHELQGHEIRRPDPTGLLFVVCLHGTAWNRVPATLWPSDACRLIRHDEGIDWARLVGLARARHLTLPIYDCLRFLTTVLEVPVPPDVLDQLGASRILELEYMEYAAVARGVPGSAMGERWAMRHLATRRAEERLTRGSARGEREPGAPQQPQMLVDPRPGIVVSERPLVSCLCVTENRQAFLPWLLWCYDRQDWPRRELVIVDSSEPPLALPERPDVRVLRAPPGTALGKKRNLALEGAGGELFAWFDDDDWQHPQRLSLLIERLKVPTTRADATHVGPSNGWFVDLFGAGATEYRSQSFALFNGSIFVGRNARCQKFSDELRSAEDTVWLRALGRRWLAFGDSLPPLFFWLCHDENTSNPRTARIFDRRLEELREKVGTHWGDTDQQLEALRERIKRGSLPAEQKGRAATQTERLPALRTPSMWVVTPCMNRLSFLKETAPLVLRNRAVRYCLVDYSCPERSGDWIEAAFPEAVRSGRCVVERVDGKTLFNKCTAHNAGARRALAEGAEYLCFLDADTVVEPAFFDWLLPRLERKRFFVAARRADGHDMPSLTGLLAVSAAEFGETDGFDEEFKGWGSEDIEMRLRLHVRHGLAYAEIPLALVRPLPHDDTLRSSHYAEKDIHRSDQRNFSRMIHKLNAWRRERPFDRQSVGRLLYKPPPIDQQPAPRFGLQSPPTPTSMPRGTMESVLHAPASSQLESSGFVVHGAEGSAVFDDQLIASSKRVWRVRVFAACLGGAKDAPPPLCTLSVPSPAPYFEHDALIAVLAERRKDWVKCDYVGVVNPDFGVERGLDWSDLGRALVSTRGGYAVYGIGAPVDEATVWRSLGKLETRALDIAREILVRRLGVPESALMRRVTLFAKGAWIARREVFERYVREWLLPAREALEDKGDRRLQKLLAQPSPANAPLPPKRWVLTTRDGRPDSSYQPYVLARLAPLFFAHAGFRVRAM